MNNKKKNNSHDQQHVNLHNVLSLGYGAPTGYNISGTSSIVGAPAIANFYPKIIQKFNPRWMPTLYRGVSGWTGF